MGYYSEVAIVLTKDAHTAFTKALATATPEVRKEVEELLKTTKHISSNGDVLFHWEYVKWYESFEEVAFMEKFMRALDSDDYAYIRIGESIDDASEEGGFWDNPFEACTSRTIAYSIDFQQETAC